MRTVLVVEVILAAVLALAVWNQLQQPIGKQNNAGPMQPSGPAAQQPDVLYSKVELQSPNIPPLEMLVETVERPLFDSGRRPPPEEPTENAQAGADTESLTVPVEPPSVQLDAVVLSGERRLALFSGGTVDSQRVAEGGVIDGWIVSEIREDQVVLRKENQSETLDLRRFETPAVAERPLPRRREPARTRASAPTRGTRGTGPGAASASKRVSTTQPARPKRGNSGASLAQQSKQATAKGTLNRRNQLNRSLQNR